MSPSENDRSPFGGTTNGENDSPTAPQQPIDYQRLAEQILGPNSPQSLRPNMSPSSGMPSVPARSPQGPRAAGRVIAFAAALLLLLVAALAGTTTVWLVLHM